MRVDVGSRFLRLRTANATCGWTQIKPYAEHSVARQLRRSHRWNDEASLLVVLLHKWVLGSTSWLFFSWYVYYVCAYVHECAHMCMQVCMCTLIGGLPPFPISLLAGAVRQVKPNWKSIATGMLSKATPEQVHWCQRMRSKKLSTEARAGKFYIS